MPHMKMQHDIDPRRVVLDSVGDHSGVEVFLNNVLVATYERPKKTMSGLYLSDKTTNDDQYMGKVGLVLKVGPTAYQDDNNVQFYGMSVKEGDWVALKPADGWPLSVNGHPCRVVGDQNIKVRLNEPDLVY